MRYSTSTFGDFKCGHCHVMVSSAHFLSGVNNRNHCPYCLWSRHVDLSAAGDRLETCLGLMQPVGLTLKITPKKDSSATAGELMLIHQCTGCGKLSINRIAADDDSQTILAVYQAKGYTARLKAEKALHEKNTAASVTRFQPPDK